MPYQRLRTEKRTKRLPFQRLRLPIDSKKCSILSRFVGAGCCIADVHKSRAHRTPYMVVLSSCTTSDRAYSRVAICHLLRDVPHCGGPRDFGREQAADLLSVGLRVRSGAARTAQWGLRGQQVMSFPFYACRFHRGQGALESVPRISVTASSLCENPVLEIE
jgi:hypothetical protein